MPDRVVALQLLSSYWLAVILPPLPGILCFSAIYNNERISAFSNLSPYFHQGRKFGGYKILPKPCKDTSSPQKENTGVCMFNYECTQRAGTVVGSCMDGFLYGTCCKLPVGVSVSTVEDTSPAADTTSSKPASFLSSSAVNDHRSTTISHHHANKPPHIEHSPEETFLLYKNGTVVQNVYSPDDFLFFTKQQTPLYMHTSPLPETDIYDNTKVHHQQTVSDSNDLNKRATYHYQKLTTLSNGDNAAHNTNSNSNNNISPSQIFDLAMSSYSKPPSTSTPKSENRHTSTTPKPYYTTSSSREPFSPNFPSKYGSSMAHTTKISPPTTVRTNDGYSSSSTSKYLFSTTPQLTSVYGSEITNKNDVFDEDENLVRVPTLTAENVHNKYGSNQNNNSSINHILWLLNDTRYESEIETETATQPTQSFYTWLSVQNNAEKSSSQSYHTKPVTHSIYHDKTSSTPMSSTTVHHIPGPAFHVTPEVKITPKPPNNAESVPTVIVLTSAQDTNPNPSPSIGQKKPVFSYATTASYNVSYHFPQAGSSSSNKPYVKPSYSSKPYQDKPKPTYSLLITAKPSQASISSSSTIRPVTAGYISKPIYSDLGTSSKPALFSTTPFTTSQKPPLKAQITQSTSIYTPKPETPSTSTMPSLMQTTIVTTAKPIFGSNLHASDSVLKPVYSPSPIPSLTNSVPLYSTSSYVSIKPSGSNLYSTTPPLYFEDNPTRPVYPFGNYLINSTEDLIAFPPVRDPNVNLTATQQENPLITSTTTFGDDETEVTPQFVVDKTLEDKVHVFVEKIVQSLQGNFEDLEKVLITGESTNNVTVSNGSPNKKPTTVTKKPTKKPTGTTKPSSARPPSAKPAITTLPVTPTLITKKPTKKPSLATTVQLFQPSSTAQNTIVTLPNKKPIKITTTVSILPASSLSSSTEQTPSSVSFYEEEQFVTTTKIGTGSGTGSEEQGDFRRECGIRPLARKNGRIVGGKGSTFGEWPWQVLVRETTWLGLFKKNKCGGVLITNRHVITAAHCQPGFWAHLEAVFGEYDISGEVESKRSVSRNVRRVILHRQYDAATFENDIALLELESPIEFDSHIVPICLPDDDEDFTGRMATVTGWGRLKYGGGVPSVLQEVQVPVIENRVCQEMFQTAGHSKVILSSFLCAGYANGQRDSCEGDSGGPLMVERNDGRWVLVATVSHGIKCAAPYLPGVYMRTTYYKPWLQTVTKLQGVA
ncbi:serine protease filzig-like [Planococcus citri]|uniref:serine protease filzig-like n=1 Tax=Planococcus citri TaxID=170843 RepID=UPI0031F78846